MYAKVDYVKYGAIYARASTNKQGDTVEHQVDMIKEYAKRSNMNIIFDDRFIYIDEGESAFKTTLLQRPAMRRLLTDIGNGLIEVVFFKGISRFARDSGESIQTAKRLVNKGVRVLSLEENYDSVRDDPTMFQIYAVMAENESRKTSIRVSLGNKQKARNGDWPSAVTPLGYTKVKDLDDKELKQKLLAAGRRPHSLHPDENAELIKLIFDLYVKENMGRKKIVSTINNLGYRTRSGSLFIEKYIKEILANEAYIGNVVYGKTRYEYVEDENSDKKIQKTVHIDEEDWIRTVNAHPPIIEKEVFEMAQKKINEIKKMYKRQPNFNAAKHPLTGLLICGKCGANMVCQKRSNKRKDGTKIEYRYYICTTYHSKGRDICTQANVNADKLEEELFSFILEKLEEYSNFNVTDKVKEKDSKKQEIQTNIFQLEQLLKKKINASKALLESRDFYDPETFIEINKEIQDEIKNLRTKKIELEETLKTLEDGNSDLDLIQLFEQFKDKIPDDIQTKRKVFHQLLDSIVIEDSKIKEINFKNPSLHYS